MLEGCHVGFEEYELVECEALICVDPVVSPSGRRPEAAAGLASFGEANSMLFHPVLTVSRSSVWGGLLSGLGMVMNLLQSITKNWIS